MKNTGTIVVAAALGLGTALLPFMASADTTQAPVQGGVVVAPVTGPAVIPNDQVIATIEIRAAQAKAAREAANQAAINAQVLAANGITTTTTTTTGAPPSSGNTAGPIGGLGVGATTGSSVSSTVPVPITTTPPGGKTTIQVNGVQVPPAVSSNGVLANDQVILLQRIASDKAKAAKSAANDAAQAAILTAQNTANVQNSSTLGQ